ncbi:protein of unknown function [Methylorubrum extorquens]|uniref:Uncharacterized protein n=1 Tax=Methylorubrum extorquens TaxID=408 RepID=A0A2N9AWA0_METEX|nr:protein of unknown function [Methylorubrum extorquens]
MSFVPQMPETTFSARSGRVQG